MTLEGFENFLQRHEDPTDAARELYRQTGQLREQRRELNGQITNLEAERADLQQQVQQLQQQLPAEDAVVIAGDDIARWTQYQSLGDPTDIHAQLQQAQTERRRADLLHAAQVSGWNLAVLSHLVPDTAQLAVRGVQTDDGATADRVFIRIDEAETALADYAAQHWTDFLPALEASIQRPPTTHSGSGAVAYPRQHTRPKAPAQANLALERLKAAKDAHQPLDI